MLRYGDYSRLDRERLERIAITQDFNEGATLRKVCKRLGWSREQVWKALHEGRLLGIQMTRNKFRRQPDKRVFERGWTTSVRYPTWQFEAKIRRSLPKILSYLRSELYTKINPAEFNFCEFYRTVRAFLFQENQRFDERRPIDYLRGDKKEVRQVLAFFSN